MNKRSGLDPILLEMIVATLVFAISAAVIVQLLGAAVSWSDHSRERSDALAALGAMTEELLADEERLASGVRQEREQNGAVLSIDISNEQRKTGVYYALECEAAIDGETALSWQAGRFIQNVEVTP